MRLFDLAAAAQVAQASASLVAPITLPRLQCAVGHGLGEGADFHAYLGGCEHRRDPWSQAVTTPPDL